MHVSEDRHDVDKNNGGHDGGWTTADRNSKKRQRHSTGGTSSTPSHIPLLKNDFIKQSVDGKLTTIFDMLASMNSISERTTSLETRMSSSEHASIDTQKRLKVLEYQSINHEARARRLNLIFRGLEEDMNINTKEDCFELVKTFLQKELQLEYASEIKMQRAHRLGFSSRPSNSKAPQKIRPVIVCFYFQEDVNLILEHASRLKGKPHFSISRDFPAEIVKARSRLWSRYKEEKGRNPPKSVFIGYPAKLVVKGKVIHDEFPDWNQMLKESRIQNHKPNTDNLSIDPIPTTSHTGTGPVPSNRDEMDSSTVTHSQSKVPVIESESESDSDSEMSNYNQAMQLLDSSQKQKPNPKTTNELSQAGTVQP